jgi:hypothetical protein
MNERVIHVIGNRLIFGITVCRLLLVFFLIDIKYLFALNQRNFKKSPESAASNKKFVQTTIRKTIEDFVDELGFLLSEIQNLSLVGIFLFTS